MCATRTALASGMATGERSVGGVERVCSQSHLCSAPRVPVFYPNPAQSQPCSITPTLLRAFRSDRSAKWAQLIGFDGERTGVDDGTFWIDWTHFLMGFSIVEVCLARRGWHCNSLPNSFPPKSSAWRGDPADPSSGAETLNQLRVSPCALALAR